MANTQTQSQSKAKKRITKQKQKVLDKQPNPCSNIEDAEIIFVTQEARVISQDLALNAAFIGYPSEFVGELAKTMFLKKDQARNAEEVHIMKKEENKRPTEQSRTKEAITALLDEAVAFLNKSSIIDPSSSNITHQNNFAVSKIVNDAATEAKPIPENVENADNEFDKLKHLQAQTQFSKRGVNAAGPQIPVAEQLLKFSCNELLNGSWLLDTDPKVICDLCPEDQVDIREFQSLQSKMDHYKQAHQKYICFFCHRSFNLLRHEQDHRKVEHKALIDNCQQAAEAKQKKLRQQGQIDFYLKRQPKINCTSVGCRYATSDQVALLAHHICFHGDYDSRSIRVQLISADQAVDDVSDADIQRLINNGILQQQHNQNYLRANPQAFGQDRALIIQYRGKVMGAAHFYIPKHRFERVCLLLNIWVPQTFKLEIGILTERLESYMSTQRATEIFCLADCITAKQLSPFKFFSSHQFGKIAWFQRIGISSEGKHLISCKTSCCISSLVSQIATPKTEYKSKAGIALNMLMNELRTRGIEQLLQRYLQLQMLSSRAKQNSEAKLSDQAITTDLVFDSIYNKIKVKREHFFDCCIFQKKWNAKSHFNALTEEWLGNFVFCNPPYSVTSCFVTKAIIEFLSGKSIVMVIPQPRNSNNLTRTLLPYLADVHKQGLIRFDPFLDVVQSPIQIVYLIQPEHLNFLEVFNQRRHNQTFPYIHGPMEGLLQCKIRQDLVKESGLRLLSQKVSQNEVKRLVNLSSCIPGAWVKTDLESFNKISLISSVCSMNDQHCEAQIVI